VVVVWTYYLDFWWKTRRRVASRAAAPRLMFRNGVASWYGQLHHLLRETAQLPEVRVCQHLDWSSTLLMSRLRVQLLPECKPHHDLGLTDTSKLLFLYWVMSLFVTSHGLSTTFDL
jgi:hypothetical protein